MKEKLKRKELVIGTWLTLAEPAIAEILVKAGFDWVTVDLEHSVLSLKDAQSLIRVAQLSGKSALVRLTSNDKNQIKRVMDAGANGIIVPCVNSVKEAEAAVAAVYYPPRGNRGVGLARAQGYGASFDSYKMSLNQNAVVIVQIEHIDAVENIKEILSCDGVDGFIIGPYDLSASMGYPGEYDRDDVKAAIKKINEAASEISVPRGIHIVEPKPELLIEAIQSGYTFIAYSVDFRMLDVMCRNALANIKEITHDRVKV